MLGLPGKVVIKNLFSRMGQSASSAFKRFHTGIKKGLEGSAVKGLPTAATNYLKTRRLDNAMLNVGANTARLAAKGVGGLGTGISYMGSKAAKLAAWTPKSSRVTNTSGKILGGAKTMAFVGAGVGRGITKALVHPGTSLTVGAVGMLGISMMKGIHNQARDIVYDRYLQDQRYSRSMLNNSRVGLASGTSRMLRDGGTQGLSLAMSSNRHG